MADGAARTGSNPRVLVALGILGAVLVGVLLWQFVLSGDDGDSGSAPIASTPAPGASTTTTTTTTAPPGQPGSFNVFATKNPFQPLVQPTSGGTGGTGGTGGGGTTTPTTVPPTNVPGTNGAVPPSGSTVAVLDVFVSNGVRTARVQVGSTVYTVTTGQTFAVSYRVVSLSETCGVFQYADSTFELCEGEQALK